MTEVLCWLPLLPTQSLLPLRRVDDPSWFKSLNAELETFSLMERGSFYQGVNFQADERHFVAVGYLNRRQMLPRQRNHARW
jgi:hypothetical protein